MLCIKCFTVFEKLEFYLGMFYVGYSIYNLSTTQFMSLVHRTEKSRFTFDEFKILHRLTNHFSFKAVVRTRRSTTQLTDLTDTVFN